MHTHPDTSQPAFDRTLVGIERCRDIVFPDADSAPSIRTWKKWQSLGYYPIHRIGRRVFADPVEVRAALDRRFRVNAVPTN